MDEPEGKSLSEGESPDRCSDDEAEDSSSAESNFDEQSVLDDWMVSLPALQRKTLAVLLMESFRSRQQKVCEGCSTRGSFDYWVQ